MISAPMPVRIALRHPCQIGRARQHLHARRRGAQRGRQFCLLVDGLQARAHHGNTSRHRSCCHDTGGDLGAAGKAGKARIGNLGLARYLAYPALARIADAFKLGLDLITAHGRKADGYPFFSHDLFSRS